VEYTVQSVTVTNHIRAIICINNYTSTTRDETPWSPINNSCKITHVKTTTEAKTITQKWKVSLQAAASARNS